MLFSMLSSKHFSEVCALIGLIFSTLFAFLDQFASSTSSSIFFSDLDKNNSSFLPLSSPHFLVLLS
ncbi:exported protein of unknown function [Candidatus Nitrosotalea okcheonensis]|uniref:Uncharacterized protein n=1 Tax=Candidatus Nitrosotalea okcheonensis TaxID=1903276 RepID=A0A2H1FC76_9ARCH|nr:exported protein of unknown function [Candidatus Nitrosotalea okcheonensis]